jgi:hypothetical protein
MMRTMRESRQSEEREKFMEHGTLIHVLTDDKVLHRAYMYSVMIMIMHKSNKSIDDKLFMKA